MSLSDCINIPFALTTELTQYGTYVQVLSKDLPPIFRTASRKKSVSVQIYPDSHAHTIQHSSWQSGSRTLTTVLSWNLGDVAFGTGDVPDESRPTGNGLNPGHGEAMPLREDEGKFRVVRESSLFQGRELRPRWVLTETVARALGLLTA
jgi:hypothetical protein